LELSSPFCIAQCYVKLRTFLGGCIVSLDPGGFLARKTHINEAVVINPMFEFFAMP